MKRRSWIGRQLRIGSCGAVALMWLALAAVGCAPAAVQTRGASPSTPDGVSEMSGEDVTAELGAGDPAATGAAATTEEWVSVPLRVLFPGGGSELDAEGRAVMRELREQMARGDVAGVRVTGHADSGGSADANHQLGLERAQEAADFATELGVPPEMIQVESRGDERPITSDTTAADRVQNRRVEVSVLVRRPRGAAARTAVAAAPRALLSGASTPRRVSRATRRRERRRARAAVAAPPAVAVSGSVALLPAAPPPPSRYEPAHISRLLTATTVDDVARRGAYLSYLSRHPAEGTQVGLDMTRRLRFRVLDGRNRPIHDATVSLGVGDATVTGQTHADGFWDCYPGVNSPATSGPAQVSVRWRNHQAQATVHISPAGDTRDVVVQLSDARAPTPVRLDLAFAIDATGSMGDELQYVTDELAGIVARVRDGAEQVEIRVGATFYRDRGDRVPVQHIPFTTNLRSFVRRMGRVEATGGGDYPEDLNTGLAAAINRLQWSTRPSVRVLVLIADAPPQDYPTQYTYRHAMADASRRGIRILPVAASGADRLVENLFRAMAAYTSTPYVYLTDDSGIGGHHMEADTDRISIEMFSDLLTRLLVSDLRGHGMHEPQHSAQAQAPALTAF